MVCSAHHAPRSWRRTVRAGVGRALVCAGLFLTGALPLSARQVDTLRVDTLRVDTLRVDTLQVDARAATPARRPASVGQRAGGERPTPGGAFLRSLVLPGWGQAASGAYSRAVFYVVMESSSAYMLVKTQKTLEDARDRVTFREGVVTRRANDAGIVDPDSIQAFVDADESVADARALEEGRAQQREDWLAFGLFMLLLSGADAFVSAHLSDFPEALTVEARSTTDGSPAVEIKVGLPWSPGGFRPQTGH